MKGGGAWMWALKVVGWILKHNMMLNVISLCVCSVVNVFFGFFSSTGSCATAWLVWDANSLAIKLLYKRPELDYSFPVCLMFAHEAKPRFNRQFGFESQIQRCTAVF